MRRAEIGHHHHIAGPWAKSEPSRRYSGKRKQIAASIKLYSAS